jgi:predicted RNA-binding Zn ribbon-like protein
LEEDSAPVDQILWRVAQSAGELLTSEWVDRLGLCRGDRCMWLFVDKSRNRSRRWCDMGDCGNLAKVRAFRERAKAG